ncbi:LOW QUALITY PROTEIN: F-box only protein 50-like, partial [Brachyhypopomus gauderio]|uniref:LOW QUALITY PROTEIN: F-box only protein 50-like n=1 Tax=Brachyhypopomus gauderio TaxID=698409 RepID=UPI0040413378
MEAEWKLKCDSEWHLGANGVPMPDSVDWKTVYDKRPLERNLVKNPKPHDVTHETPPPEREFTGAPPTGGGPPQVEPTGDFTGWTTSTEVLPYDTSGIPPGVVICHLPQFRWFSMSQQIDLKAEGLWDDLLDTFQPDIVIDDWYEESQLDASVYELHVKLLAADHQTVIKEHHCTPTEDLENYSHTWKQVSHTFSGYGPGVRYILFEHKVKNKFMIEFFGTLITDSS